MVCVGYIFLCTGKHYLQKKEKWGFNHLHFLFIITPTYLGITKVLSDLSCSSNLSLGWSDLSGLPGWSNLSDLSLSSNLSLGWSNLSGLPGWSNLSSLPGWSNLLDLGVGLNLSDLGVELYFSPLGAELILPQPWPVLTGLLSSGWLKIS